MSDTLDYKTAKAIAKAKRPFFKKKRYWLLASVAVVSIGMMAGGLGGGSDATATDNDSSSSSSASKPVAVTAASLIKQFEENELQADAKYKGKTLKITGIVEGIDTEMFDEEDYVLRPDRRRRLRDPRGPRLRHPDRGPRFYQQAATSPCSALMTRDDTSIDMFVEPATRSGVSTWGRSGVIPDVRDTSRAYRPAYG